MGLLFVLVWVSLTALAGGSWRYLATRRRRRISAFAAQMGLSFSAEDTFGLVDHAFDLFNLGDLARCRNVVWGTFEGVEVKSGDLYFVSSSAAVPAGMDRLERGGLRFVFAETEVDAFLPHVSIRHRDWVPEGLQPNELPFESDDFNRRFLVRGDDRRFAYEFVVGDDASAALVAGAAVTGHLVRDEAPVAVLDVAGEALAQAYFRHGGAPAGGRI